MGKIICFTIFILFIIKCDAQQQELDSLLNKLKTYTKEDSVRLSILNDIAFDYSFINPQKGLETADEAIALAHKIGHTLKLAAAYNYKGVNYNAQGNDSMALEMYQQALSIYEQAGEKLRLATTYNNFAITYVNLSDYAKALEYHKKALSIFEELDDKPRLARSYNNIGVVYLSLAIYPKALEYYFKALDIIEQLHDTLTLGNAFTNIGLVYAHLSNFSKSLEYHENALKVFEGSGNKDGIAKTLSNMANVYDDLGKWDKALEFYQKALAIAEVLQNRKGITNNFINIAIVYIDQKQYDKALQYLQKALPLCEQAGDRNNLSVIFAQMGNCYLNAAGDVLKRNGITVSERYKKAADLQNRSLILGKEIGALDRQSEAWENLYNVYEKQKAFDKALQAYKQYIIMRDSIINDERKQEITRNEIQYEYDKKEELLKAEHEKKEALAEADAVKQRVVKNSIIGGSGVLMIAVISSFVFYKRRRDAEEQKKEAVFKAQVSDTEMKVLRLQMNPHFIFNSLNSIGDYMQKHDIKAADDYLSKFARVMRITLENSEQKAITLEEELKGLELYMQLESLRLNNKFEYEIRVDADIDKENTLVPPMILQPFVENSIWHGIAKKQGQGKILIEIKKENEMINCVVEDNGTGMESSRQPADKKSLGMKITKARIDILNKIKNSKAAIQLFNKAEGVRVEVKLPLELSF